MTPLPAKVYRLTHLDGPGTIKAFCDVLVADTLLLKSFRVLEGKHGLFIGMPREQGRDGHWYEQVIPMSQAMHQELERLILTKYQRSRA